MGDATQGAGDALLRGGGALISGAVASKLRKVHCAPAVGALDAQIGRGQVLLGALQAHEERTDDPTEEKILAGHQVAIDRQLKVAIPAAGQLAAKLEQANISTAPQQSSGQSNSETEDTTEEEEKSKLAKALEAAKAAAQKLVHKTGDALGHLGNAAAQEVNADVAEIEQHKEELKLANKDAKETLMELNRQLREGK